MLFAPAPGHRGFTLLEVLVALAIAGLLFVGLGGILQQQIKTESHLERKAAAAQVARNLLAEAEIHHDQVEEGTTNGEMEMGGWKFPWSQTVSIYTVEDEEGTQQAVALQMQIDVGDQEETIEQAALYLPLKTAEVP